MKSQCDGLCVGRGTARELCEQADAVHTDTVGFFFPPVQFCIGKRSTLFINYTK